MSTIKQHAPRPLYVYLSSEGIDSLLQYAIMPAGAVGSPAFFHLLWVHFDGKAGGKIIKIAIVYGLMMSSLKLSRVVGSDLLVSLSLWRDINQQPDQQALAFVLAVCCIALTFSYVGDNCYLVALLSIIITSTGCIMSERFGNAFVKHQRPSGFSSSTGNATIAMNGLSSMPSSNLVNSSNSFYSPENKLRRNMIAYIFSTLLVSLLFHEDTKFAIAKVSTPTEINRHGVTAADFIHHCHFSLYALLAGFAVLVFLYHVYTGFHARLHSSITLDSISSSSSHGRETPHKSFWSAIFSSRQSQDIMGDITLSHVETNEEVTNGSQEKSPLIIPTDGFIPSNFVVACKGNTIDATKMYHSSLRWRHSNGTDSILSTPQPNFQQILDYYPHYIHGYSIDGCVVVYELLGRAKLRELTAKGITPDDLVRHFNLRNEFIFKRFQQKTAIYPILTSNTKARSSEIIRNNHGKHQDDDIHNDQINRDQASIVRIMTIIDVKGISLYDFTADVVTFIKQSSEIMDAYYPGNLTALFLLLFIRNHK